jgi:hypothetical protein
VPWLLLAAGLLRTYRAGVPTWTRHAVVFGTAAAAVLSLLGAFAAVIGGWIRPWLFNVLLVVPVRKIGASPLATAALWAAAAVLLTAAYAIARRQFERMEIPAQGAKCTLVDWMREES